MAQSIHRQLIIGGILAAALGGAAFGEDQAAGTANGVDSTGRLATSWSPAPAASGERACNAGPNIQSRFDIRTILPAAAGISKQGG